MLLRNCVWMVAMACQSAVTHAGRADDAGPLKVGSTIPGPFQVLMVTGPRAGTFHAPICEFDLNPSVLVFVRDGADVAKPLSTLLKGLDAAIAQNPQARLAASVVFLNDGGYRQALETPLEEKKVAELTLTTATLAKEVKVAQAGALAKQENLKHVTLALGAVGGPPGYKLTPDADVTVLILNQQRIVAAHTFAKGQFTEAEVHKMLQTVDGLAEEVTKASARRRI